MARIRERAVGVEVMQSLTPAQQVVKICLLYTSDAADERSSVDLGGRRIIKKKNDTAPALRVITRYTHYTHTNATRR